MSFLTRYSSLIIGGSTAPGGFLAGTPTLISDPATITPDGWDSLTQTYAIRRSTLTPEDLAALFPIGTKLTDRNFWIQDAKPTPHSPGIWLAEIGLKGWAFTKPYKVKIGSTLQQSGNNARAGGVAYNTTLPALSVSYLVPDADDPAVLAHLALVGTAVAAESLPVPMPAVTPWIPWTPVEEDLTVYPWYHPSTLTPCTYNHPSGWILNSSEQERLTGCSAAIITDSYGYKPMYSPA